MSFGLPHRPICVTATRAGGQQKFKCDFCAFTADTEFGADSHVRSRHKVEREKALAEARGKTK